jgi:type II secretory pathway predicted ATPase ExeA
LARLQPTHYHAIYVAVGEDWTLRTLYRDLAYELQLAVPVRPLDIERGVRAALWAEWTQQGRLPVVVLDEAHWLAPAVLQGLRGLVNFSMDTTAPLALVLIGHTELRRKMALQPLEALRDRVTMAFHLPALTAEQTTDYVQYHLRHVGIDRPVFTETALRAARDWAQGRPRRLNSWARACLLAAFVAQQPLVDDDVVAAAQAELQWTQPVVREGGRPA